MARAADRRRRDRTKRILREEGAKNAGTAPELGALWRPLALRIDASEYGSSTASVSAALAPIVAGQAAPSTPSGSGNFAPTVFTPGENHGHQPIGAWADVQRSEMPACALRGTLHPVLYANQHCVCATSSPATVLKLARDIELSGLPLAQKHLDHYLTGGGADLPVDLGDIVRRDVGVQAVLAFAMRSAETGSVRIEQANYDVKDFQYALGAIDRLDFEVDHAAGLVHIWFKDRYEFHPVGFGYSAFPGEEARDTNCVHAAAVELKTSGAADYWMVGDAVVPESLFAGPKSLSWGTSERQEQEY